MAKENTSASANSPRKNSPHLTQQLAMPRQPPPSHTLPTHLLQLGQHLLLAPLLLALLARAQHERQMRHVLVGNTLLRVVEGFDTRALRERTQSCTEGQS